MNICFNLFEVVVHCIFLLQSSLLSLLGLFCVFSLQGCFAVCLLKQFGCTAQQEMSFCRSQWQKLDAFLLQL